jgi:hypothetical protein
MEHLVTFLVWALTVIGVSVIVTQSPLFLTPRTKIATFNRYLGTLLFCPLCFSFWAALGVSLLMESLTGNLFLDGCLGSGLWFYTTFGAQMPPMPQMMPPMQPPMQPPTNKED